MPSLIQGYEYDIFISYRHNDNLDGWVTDFVQNLEKELRSTLKDSLTIYFDKNPHDGLLETHNVDKSLEGKLKCLIFIPIISQTYCDTKSFAWQHEFVAFNKLAKEDQFGRDIKLSNGNVASRILPIKIHELDLYDKTAFENEIGAALRGIEFIFQSSGVNRPLTPNDRREENTARHFYSDQINKVANAVKQLIVGIRQPETVSSNPSLIKEAIREKTGPKPFPLKWIMFIFVLVTLAFVSYFLVTYQDKGPAKKFRVLVMPFSTSDTARIYFADGITTDMVTELGKVKGFSTLSWKTSLDYNNSIKTFQEIAEETGATHFLIGDVQRSASRLRINVSLVDPQSEENLWGETWENDISHIFDIQKEIAIDVSRELKLQLKPEEERLLLTRYHTKSIEAYDLLLKARAEIRKLYTISPEPYYASNNYLNQALEIDPDFPEALIMKAYLRTELAWLVGLDPAIQNIEAQKEIARALKYNPTSSDAYAVAGMINFFFEWDMEKAKKNFEKSWELSNYGETSIYQCNCGYVGYRLAKGDYQGALSIIEKIENLDPNYPYGSIERLVIYRSLQDTSKIKEILNSNIHVARTKTFEPAFYYELGQYKESIESFKKAGTSFIWPTNYLASAYYKGGFVNKSDSIINEMIARSSSERNIDFGLSIIYASRGDKVNSLKWFKSAYEKHDFWLPYARSDADLRLIIDEPYVKEMLVKIGL